VELVIPPLVEFFILRVLYHSGALREGEYQYKRNFMDTRLCNSTCVHFDTPDCSNNEWRGEHVGYATYTIDLHGLDIDVYKCSRYERNVL